jgi:transposase-like protein
MKPFTGITRFFSRDTTARVARVCIVNLKSIPSSVRCNSTLDKSGSLANSDSSDTVDTADAAETSSSLNTPDASRQNSVTNTGVPGSARSKWTPDDRRILRDALERGMNHKDIAALFPSRTLSAVARQCTLTQKHLGLQGHSGEEHSRSPRSAAEKKLLTEFHSAGASTYKLRIHFPTRSSDSIAKALARYITHASTNNKAKPRWTLEERWKLTELCSQGLSIKELVEVLGRSYSAVSVQASKLGLKYADKRKPFSAEDVQVVLQMRDEGATYRAISAALGRKHSSTASYIYCLHRPKDRDIKPARCPRAQLSLDELGNVSALRAQRTPWSSIARQYPKHELSWIREQYRMWAGFDLSPTQLQEVERLREARKSWKYIADTGEFTCYSNDGIIAAYRRALAKQQTQG